MDISAATEVSPAPRLRVLLMQLPVPNNPATNVPLAAGYLKAYAQAQGLLEQVDVDILPRALADHAGNALLVEEIVARRLLRPAPAALTQRQILDHWRHSWRGRLAVSLAHPPAYLDQGCLCHLPIPRLL